MFGGKVEMVPNRPGNRMSTEVDHSKTTDEFCWVAKKRLADYVAELKR
jgi:hypothetical protein